MAHTIGILTGGGDVPGLNPAIRAITIRALRQGYRVVGIRRGWGGLVDLPREKEADTSAHVTTLTEEVVNRAGRTGGTFLHTSRTRPSHLPKAIVPSHLADKYTAEINDMTPDVLKNLELLGIDYLIPIGGDDTLSYADRLHKEGVRVVAIPKTMDNDVPGTDYCIGFSTCVTRTIEMTHRLRTTAGSHERFLVIEVFGRYAGYTALLPTMAGAADRCVIPEQSFEIERLTATMPSSWYPRAHGCQGTMACPLREASGTSSATASLVESETRSPPCSKTSPPISKVATGPTSSASDSVTWCGVVIPTRSTQSFQWLSGTSPWTW
jgi:6-phosphofructokinase 1